MEQCAVVLALARLPIARWLASAPEWARKDKKMLDVEPREIREKRRKVAEAFFSQYISQASEQDAVEAIQELIAYDGDLDSIAQMMALSIDS